MITKHDLEIQSNNKGFTLLELMISIAIVGVISFLVGSLMMNGSRWYTGESSKADIQNDIQTVNTKVQKALMEATAITVKEQNGVTYILTGEWYEDTASGTSGWVAESNPNSTARQIIAYKNKIYVTNTFYEPSAVIAGLVPKGYEVSSNLKEGTFKAEAIYTAFEDTATSTLKLDSPVKVKISYSMTKRRKNSKTSYVVTLRNSGSLASINGVTVAAD